MTHQNPNKGDEHFLSVQNQNLRNRDAEYNFMQIELQLSVEAVPGSPRKVTEGPPRWQVTTLELERSENRIQSMHSVWRSRRDVF